MKLALEDRLWEQLESAADRDAARGRGARAAATVRGALPAAGPRLAVVAVVAAAIAVALVVGRPPDRSGPHWRVERVGVSGVHLGAGVAGLGGLWSYDASSQRVLRLDPRSHRVVARVPVPAGTSSVALALSADAVWAVPSAPIRHSSPAPADLAPSTLLRIDPRTNRVAGRVVLRAAGGATLRPVDLVARQGAIWVWGEGGALRVDPARGRVTSVIVLPDERIMGFAATDTRVSVLTDLGQLVTLDARTGRRLAAVPLVAPVNGEELVAIGDDVVVYRQGGTLASTDPLTGRDRWAVHVGSQPRDLTLTGGRLWLLLAGARNSELRALDTGSGRTVARVALPSDDARAVAPAGAAPVVTTQGGELLAVRPPR